MGIGKILSKVGVEAQDVPTEEEEARAKRHQNIVLAWRYLRNMIDQGIAEYFETGDTTKLEKACVSPVRERLLEQVKVLRGQGLVWSFPERDVRSQAVIEVVHETLDDRNIPTSFVIREIFHDHSALIQLDTSSNAIGQSAGDGTRRILEAQVICPGPVEYFLQDVRQIQLGD